MWCPYCGDEMRSGVVRLRGQWAIFPWSGALTLNFEVDDGSGEGSEILPRRRFRVDERAANCCVRCEAVLVDPKSGPAPTTATRRRPAATETATEIDLSGGDAADGAPAAAAPPPTHGSSNGSSNGNGSSASPATTTDPPTSSD
jgi:hypothetical protein